MTSTTEQVPLFKDVESEGAVSRDKLPAPAQHRWGHCRGPYFPGSVITIEDTALLLVSSLKTTSKQKTFKKNPTTNQHFQEPHQQAGTRDKKPPFFLLVKAQLTQAPHLRTLNLIEVIVIRIPSSSKQSQANSKPGHTLQLQKQD